jgi:hypothetical protein
MEHTSQSHRRRDRSPTRQKSSRRSAETTNYGRTRDKDIESPSKTYRPPGRRVDRSNHRPSRRPHSPASGTEVRHPPRTHLPNYPPNIAKADMMTSMRREPLQKRRPEGSRRLSVDISYERETEATVRHISIDKPGDQGWLHAIGIPRIVTDGRRQSNDGTWSRPEATILDDRRRYYHSQGTDDNRGCKKSRVGGKGSEQAQSNHARSELTTENLKSFTKSAAREYTNQQSDQQMPNQSTVTQDKATTRRQRNRTSKKKASGPQTSRVSLRRVRDTPEQAGGSPIAAESPDRGRSPYTDGTRGTAMETQPHDEKVTSLSDDSALAYDYRPSTPTPEPIDEKRLRRDRIRRRSSNAHPSRPTGTEPRGQQQSHGRRRKRSNSSHEKWQKTTYGPPQSGCCVVL